MHLEKASSTYVLALVISFRQTGQSKLRPGNEAGLVMRLYPGPKAEAVLIPCGSRTPASIWRGQPSPSILTFGLTLEDRT
jgi:hypothetical protein